MNPEISPFLRVLDPQDNHTGGGAASAIAGAMAAALTGMVARLSIGKPGLEPEPYYADIDQQAQRLSQKLLLGAQNDSAAFDAVMAAFRLPKETESEKTHRSRQIQAAMLQASEVPLQNAQSIRATLELILALEGRSNKNAASDLECGRYLAMAGIKGCLSNVNINLQSIKDPTEQQRLAGQIQNLTIFLKDLA